MFHRKIFDFLLNVISMETFASIIMADPFIKHVEYDFPVAQTVKNLPVMQETWVLSLGWEDPLEEGIATTVILAWRIPMDRGACGLHSPWGRKELDLTEQLRIHNNDM